MYKVPAFRADFGDEERKAVVEALDSYWWSMGPRTAELEEKFAAFVGAKYAVAVNSGTAALQVAWTSLGKTKFIDEVYSPPITFVSPIQVLNQLGIPVRFTDVDTATVGMVEDDYRFGEEDVGKEGHVGIMPMHYGGQPLDVFEIRRLNKRNNPVIVEDAAHAVGASTEAGMVGNCKFSDATCFSFHTVKTLSTPGGGMVTTNDEALYKEMKLTKFFGIDKEPYDRQYADNVWSFDVTGWGSNLYMNDITASIALEQLKKLPNMIERRREIAARYSKAFECEGIEVVKYNPDQSVHHLYVLKVGNRDEFIRLMKEEGIQCGVHYIPMYHYTHWGSGGRKEYWAEKLPNTEKVFKQIMTIPLYPSMTDEQVGWVIEAVRKVNERLNG